MVTFASHLTLKIKLSGMFLVQSDIYQFLIEMGKKVSRKSLQYQIVFSF